MIEHSQGNPLVREQEKLASFASYVNNAIVDPTKVSLPAAVSETKKSPSCLIL